MTLKTKTINTGKATILVVDLPKGATNLVVKDAIKLGENHSIYPSIHYSFEGDKIIMLPMCNWKLLGFANSITESDAWQIIPDPKDECCGCNHPVTNQCCGNKIPEYDNAINELNSLLKANGVFTVNPYSKEPPHNYGLLHLYPTNDKIMDLSFQDAIRWQQAQSQLWENVFILVKVD